MPITKRPNEIVKEFTSLIGTLGQRQFAQYMYSNGLSHPQMMTIGRLYRHGGVGISEMSAHMGTTDAAVSQLIDRLVNQGFVERNECPADRRKKEVVLTAKGRAVIDSLTEQSDHLVDAILEQVAPDKLPMITEAMTVILEAAHKVEVGMDLNFRRPVSTGTDDTGKEIAEEQPDIKPPFPLPSFRPPLAKK